MKFKSVFLFFVILNLCLPSQKGVAQVDYRKGKVVVRNIIATSYQEVAIASLKKAKACLKRVEECEQDDFFDECECEEENLPAQKKRHLANPERKKRIAVRALKKYIIYMEKAKRMSEKSIIFMQKSIDEIQIFESDDSQNYPLP